MGYIKRITASYPIPSQSIQTYSRKVQSEWTSATPSKLTSAMRFMRVFLFVHVKGTRPMTYQYLTVDMCDNAKRNNGFIDQKKFKTATTYGFDSLTSEKIQ